MNHIRRGTFLQKLVISKGFWTTFILFAFSWPILRVINRELPQLPPTLDNVKSGNFVDENGLPYTLKMARGKVVILNSFFTSCSTSCPQLTEKMRRIQKRVRGVGQKVQLLSISVDPEIDTPKVLFKYARKNKANPFIWKFLRTDEKNLDSFLDFKGFKDSSREKVSLDKKVLKGKKEEKITLYDILHSQKIVLIDQKGDLRGVYSLDKSNINKLMIDVGLLVNEKEFLKRKR